MKILLVITRGDTIGGAQIHVLSIAKLLRKNGHDILICYGGATEGPFKQLLIDANLKFNTIPYLRKEISLINDLRSIFALKAIFNKFKPDLISLHSTKAGVIGRLSGLFYNKPIVFTVHGWSFTDGIRKRNTILYKAIEKLLAIVTTKIIVVSQYDRRIALENNVTQDNKIEVIHNGIKISETEKIPSKFANDITNIIMIARFDKQKDHETLIRACVDIENIKVHFLGDGPNFINMVNLSNELGIKDKFKFYGYTNEVKQILNNVDIFVLISNWEGFPISTLEAMDHFLPVVVSDVGGATEAINEGVTGYSVKRSDKDDLKSKLKKLINDPSLREAMGYAGKKMLIENFSDQVMYQNTIKIFSEIVNKDNK